MTLKIDYQIYKTGIAPFEEMLRELLDAYVPTSTPVRFVFLGNPRSNEEYLIHRSAVLREVERRFGGEAPVVSYVAQAPCGDGLLLEVHGVETTDTIHYKTLNQLPYITVENACAKRLFIGGVQGDLMQQFDKQAACVFEKLDAVMRHEQMLLCCIVRQWNYIEQITRFDESGRQHYQIFNDARSRFYASEEQNWNSGYPAATGIGTYVGGILVGLDAVQNRSGHVTIQVGKVDNPLQVAAHSYSQQVLLGREDQTIKQKTTPKFERAKTVRDTYGGVIYISGTAAIRGEQSLNCASVEEQTVMTLENIEYLISADNLRRFQTPARQDATLAYLRIYLKQAENQRAADEIIRARYPALPVLYVVADVCREELLIEMEGAAYFE